MSGRSMLQNQWRRTSMASYEYIEIEVTQKLYNSLQAIAKSYGVDVKVFIEDRLEELYG